MEAIRNHMKRIDWVTTIVVGVFVISLLYVCTGCIGPQKPKDWYEPTFEAGYSVWKGVYVRNTKDLKGKMKGSYNKESGEFNFEAEFEDTASTVNKSQEELMREFTRQQKQAIEGLQFVVDQIKAHGDNFIGGVKAFGDIVSTAASALNVKVNKDGIQAGNALAPPAAAPAADPKLEAFMKEQQELNQAILQMLHDLQNPKVPPAPEHTPASADDSPVPQS